MFCGFRDETLLAHNRWDYFFPRFLMLFIHARTSLTDTFILSFCFCLFISPSSTLWVSMPAPQCKYAPFLYGYNQSQAREKQKTLVHWENNLSVTRYHLHDVLPGQLWMCILKQDVSEVEMKTWQAIKCKHERQWDCYRIYIQLTYSWHLGKMFIKTIVYTCSRELVWCIYILLYIFFSNRQIVKCNTTT